MQQKSFFSIKSAAPTNIKIDNTKTRTKSKNNLYNQLQKKAANPKGPLKKKTDVSYAKTNRYKVCQDLYEDGELQCLAFPYPLMQFEDEKTQHDKMMAHLSDDDVRKISPSWAGAIDKWSKLSKLIFTESKEIPLKQMAIKAKHE